MQHDTNLKLFVKQNIVYQNIKYDEDLNRIFTRGYLSLNKLQKYQKERIIGIKKKVLNYQFNDMMEAKQ